MQTINLDIANKGIAQPINAKQGDVGRKFKIFIFENGIPYNITANAVLFSMWYSGPSGDGNYDTIWTSDSESQIEGRYAFDVSENSVIVEMASQMLKNPGNGLMCVTMKNSNGDIIGLWNIPYIVELVPGYLSEETKHYYPFLEDLEKKANSAVLFTQQALTLEQQEQARANIDALKVPRGISRELFASWDENDFQTQGDLDVFKFNEVLGWLHSPEDFDFRIRFAVRINIGTTEEYEFTKADCRIEETAPGGRWNFYAATNTNVATHVLTIANGIGVAGSDSENSFSIAYPSQFEDFEIELYRIENTERELKVVTSVNGIEADEYGNVKIDVGGGSGGGADGFSPVAKVTQTDTGAVISITDKKGTTTATVANGEKGDKGEKGDPGEKGDIGVSGVYVGSGEMPEGYNVQIDPSGEIDTLPTKLPNPHVLKFTGAVQAEYDGSSPTTVNIPSGGSGGVSSWNDLTDKPFYTEMGNGVVLPETAAIFVEDQGMFGIADPVALVIGEEYSVSWNGVPYSCVALPYEDDGVLMGAMLGNVGAMTGESMTEEPFLVICVTPEMMEVTGSPFGIMIMPLDGSESVTLSVSGLMEIVHPIDKKYLPKAAIPANGKVVFAKDDAGNYICNKTYEEIGMMFESGIFPWAQLNGVTNDGYPLFLKDFQVTSIGIQFSTTAYFQLANNGLSGVNHALVNIAESGEISCSVFRLDASMVTL